DVNRVPHPQALLLRLDLRQRDFMSGHLPAQTQLAAQHNVLLDEESLLASAPRTAANFLSRVAHHRIGIESRLQPPRAGGADFGCRLRQCWIVLERHLLDRFERQYWTTGVWLPSRLRRNLCRRTLQRRLVPMIGLRRLLRRWRARAAVNVLRCRITYRQQHGEDHPPAFRR